MTIFRRKEKKERDSKVEGSLVEENFKNALEKAKDTLELKFCNQNAQKLPKLLVNKLFPLQKVDLSNNKLKQFRELIIFANTLSSLKLSGNEISQIPSSIEIYRSLTIINLSGNKLESLPEEMGNLPQLKELDLSKNLLTQVQHHFFSKWVDLSYLNLSHNMIDHIPQELCTVRNLLELNLSHNQISSLPSEISDLQQLAVLDISHNQITKIPPTLTFLEKSLKLLTVHPNPISNIPNSILNEGAPMEKVLGYLEYRSKVPVDDKQCIISGDGYKNGIASEELSFTVITFDTEGNRLTCGGEELKVEISVKKFKSEKIVKLSPEQIKLADIGDGSYMVHYDGRNAGDYTVDVLINGSRMNGCPLSFIRKSKEAADFEAIRQGELMKCIVEEEVSIKLEAIDKFGNFLDIGGHKLEAIIKVPPTNCYVFDNQDGSYFVKFLPTSLGSHFIEINFQQKPIKSSPLRARVFGKSPFHSKTPNFHPTK